MPHDIILASTSPYRRQLLERLGLPFTAVAPDCDEAAAKQRIRDPLTLAETLAEAKARSVAQLHPAALVIGSDQVVALEDDILGKPGSAAAAQAQLARLAGRSHRLITAMAVINAGQVWRHSDVTTMHMRPLDGAAIARYVACDQPLDCAGAYKLEERGIALFTTIDSADHTAITGLPLLALVNHLAALGYALP